MIVFNDEFIEASKMSDEELKLEFAIWLYEKERVSLRKASKMAGITWLDFSTILSERNIPTVKMTYQDLETEVKTVNSLLK